MKIAFIVGNPNPVGRTTTVAEAVATRIGAAVGSETRISTFEHAEISGDLFTWGAEPVERVVETVRTSAVAVFASPICNARYIDLLKALLGRFAADGLDGVLAVPVMLRAHRSSNWRWRPSWELAQRPILRSLRRPGDSRGGPPFDVSCSRCAYW